MTKLHKRVNSRGSILAAVAFSLLAVPVSVKGQAIYNSIPSPFPANVASVGFEATTAKELGDGLVFTTGSSRQLTTVSVVMSSWACTSGAWFNPVGGPNPCVTSPNNATFSQPLTLNIYAVNPGSPPEPGALIASKTSTFSIPYRPSSDTYHCAPGGSPGGDGEQWYNLATGTCYHGLASIVTFDLSGMSIVLPDEAIVTVAYNTTHYGYNPIGEGAACFSTTQGCPYDSLNVGTDGDPTLGMDVDVNGIYVYWGNAGSSCSSTSGALLLDTPCWTNLHPEIQVNTTGNIAGAPPTLSMYFGNPAIPLHGTTSLNFALGNPASNTIALTGVGFTDTLPSQLEVANPSNLSNDCGGTAAAAPGSRSISLNGATLATMSSCSVSVDVVGFGAGAATNSVQVTSTNGGNGNIAMAMATVLAPPTIVKAFGTPTANVGDTTSLTFNLSNPVPQVPNMAARARVVSEIRQAGPATPPALTEIEFADVLTAGLQVANPNSATNTCGGQVSAAPGSNKITLGATSGGAPISLAQGAVCSVTVNVTATTPGVKLDNVWALSENGGDSGPSTASLTVNGTLGSVGAVSVNPNSGTGLSQTFDVLYTDTAGASNIQAVYFDVGNQGGGGPHSCFVLYVPAPSPGALYLFNDTSSGILGPITPGSASTVSNSQCTLSGSGGVVSSSGNNMTVPFNLTFKPGFSGPMNLQAYAQNYSGTNGGWQTLGNWTPAPAFLSALSLTPNGSSGLGPLTFSAVYSDNSSLGAQLLQVVYLDFGNTMFAKNSCIVAYVTFSNTLYLFNDASTGVWGPVSAGSASTVSNTQCTLSGSGGMGSITDNNFTAPFSITFAPGFTGVKDVWGLTQDYYGNQSGWLVLGTWNP